MDLFLLLAAALLPVVGNIVGGLVAESARPPQWVVGVALHAAAGIAIAVVSADLMPRILENVPTWLAVLAFVLGASFSLLLLKGVRFIQDRVGGGSVSAWMIYMAVAADSFSDGLMTGTGSAVSGRLGLMLGLSQLVGNIPGGFGALASFRASGMKRGKRILVLCSFVLPLGLGLAIGFVGLKDAGQLIQLAALAFVVGILLLTTIEDTLPQADEPSPPRLLSTASFAGGFAFFTLLSGYLQ